MIRCGKLDYECVTDALERGSFYSSTGPEIRDFWYEDGEVRVTTSPSCRINFITGARHTGTAAARPGEAITEASFRPDRARDGYVRVEVVDGRGARAATNAVWMDELPGGAR